MILQMLVAVFTACFFSSCAAPYPSQAPMMSGGPQMMPPQGGPGGPMMNRGGAPVLQGYVMEWRNPDGTVDHSKTHFSKDGSSPDGAPVRIREEDALHLSDEEFGNLLSRYKGKGPR